MIAFVVTVLVLQSIAVLCRAGLIVINEYPRKTVTKSPGAELFAMFINGVIAGWAAYLLLS